ncbi:6-phosphofructokinase [Bisgaard Taxon 10/6]|uniref:6-phosphofructokinase n=1 Tax=Exercitatus varius TaxID=67857 RepID=A0AAW6QC75_9PAST|nr:6-phosphofructokinase [Exercitatus varius]QOF67221.1 6-phosphofructokinase [Actinobacillus sp. GY-402]MDG2917461.1 6-phosphofructokinase [Exercitatus varius]MDG2939646.1 6-phosphofructokinase [Exercitatus varius]MDG2941949.1 6-phosphofructokinase [Exercitatus varius]MDG2946643.1 6-phosphofructokinase [Exercitatus varius]
MNKILMIFLTALLTGCVTSTSNKAENEQPAVRLLAPNTLKHNGKIYYLKKQVDLGPVARYVYFSKNESAKNWSSLIEVFFDKDESRTFEERIKLREKSFETSGIKHFNLTEKAPYLYSFVIHSPSEKFNNWQINVAKGKNVEDCGFVQYQYSQIMPKSRKLAKMSKVKLIGYLKKYAVDKEMAYLTTQDWDWKCTK